MLRGWSQSLLLGSKTGFTSRLESKFAFWIVDWFAYQKFAFWIVECSLLQTTDGGSLLFFVYYKTLFSQALNVPYTYKKHYYKTVLKLC